LLKIYLVIIIQAKRKSLLCHLVFSFVLYLAIWFLIFCLLSFQNKDTAESKPRGSSNTSSRGLRGGTDRYAGRGGSNQLSWSGMCMLDEILAQRVRSLGYLLV